MNTKLIKESINICNKLIKSRPDNYQAWNIKGTCLANQGKYREAIQCYDNAIQFNPHDRASTASRQQCLLALGIALCPTCGSEMMNLYGNKETGFICPKARLIPQSKFSAMYACSGDKRPTQKALFGSKCTNCGGSCQKYVTKDGLFVHLCKNSIIRTSNGKFSVPCNA